MPKVSVTLWYVRAAVAGGAHGWGPFKNQSDAEAAMQLLATGQLPGAPFVDSETHTMEDTEASGIVYHDGKFRGRGRPLA